MPTLLITIKAPLQSWAETEGYAHRDTADQPTKSGILGLIASALGLPRGTMPHWLADLHYAVQTNQAGTHLADLQTMGHDRRKHQPNPLQTKGYLQDARFTIGLEGDHATLQTIQHAIQYPTYMPYLGRRACPPAGPIPTTITNQPLETAFTQPGPIQTETPNGPDIHWDQPTGNRGFQSRTTRTTPGPHTTQA